MHYCHNLAKKRNCLVWSSLLFLFFNFKNLSSVCYMISTLVVLIIFIYFSYWFFFHRFMKLNPIELIFVCRQKRSYHVYAADVACRVTVIPAVALAANTTRASAVNPLLTTPFWNEKQTDVFKRYFFDENAWILKNICLKFIHKVVIYPKSTLLQEMDWRRSGTKPFLEAMLTKIFYSCRSLQSLKG